MKKILYLTRLDPYSLKSWSGTNFFLLKALKNNFKVINIGPLSNRVRFFFLIKKLIFSFLKIQFDIDRPILVAKDFAKQIQKKIKNLNYDAILTTDTYLVSYLKTSKPIYVFTDVTFASYYEHYFSSLKIHKQTIFEGNFCERKSLKKSKKIILTSDWAISDALVKYNINRSKFIKLPFGANILSIPNHNTVRKMIKKKLNSKVCNLISIGVHWDRKGMDKALDLVEKMNAKGCKTKLFIVGAKPPEDYSVNKNIKILDFLNKNNNYERVKIYNLLHISHFHILFSKAEAFGIVNSEASAFGIYTATHDLGGISGAIVNNVNGYRFPIETKIEVIANHLIKIYKNKKRFLNKSYLSRLEYEKKLNWNVIGNKLSKIIS